MNDPVTPAGSVEQHVGVSVAEPPLPKDEKRKKLWNRLTVGEKTELVGVFVAVATMIALIVQLQANNRTNQVAIRGQLYQTEFGMTAEERAADDSVLNTLWVVVPSSVSAEEYSRTVLSTITTDSQILDSTIARDLFEATMGLSAFSPERTIETARVRRLYLYVQNYLYHVHNAHDYHADEVLKDGEWETWRGLIREMHAHPMLLATIWQGYQYKYFSRDFGIFLRQELCGRPGEQVSEGIARGCKVAQRLYPEMFAAEWLSSLPTY